MPSYDAFTATVGVALIEGAGCLPWTAPVPPALDSARGWFVPEGAGPTLAFVLPADGLDEGALAGALAAWRGWLEGLQANEAVLLVVTTSAAEEGEPRGCWPDHPRWQAWLVDLASGRFERTAPDDTEAALGPFAQAVDAAVMAYFQGPALTPEDLAEEESARLAGKAPFLAFLETQAAPASYVLFGLVLGLYLIALGLTVGPTGLAGLPSFRMQLHVVADAFIGSSQLVLLRMGASLWPLIAQGEVWRLIAANYLHANVLHIGVNAFSIAALCPTLEKIFGTPKFLAIWTVAGATGAIASATLNREATSVGASGALFGLLGAMLALGMRYRGAIPGHQVRAIRHFALIALGCNLVLGATFPHVDNVAHLGGLVGGLAMALAVGPHPMLIGQRPRFWNGKALWIFPIVAAMAVATGLANAAIGRIPAVPFQGPTRDYEVTLPIDAQAERVNQYMIVRAPRGDHFVLVHSVPNPEGVPVGGQPALTEATLDARTYELARRYASQGARLVDRPVVVPGGHHRFLMIPVAMPEGGREEIHLTASSARIYAIRTRGLASDPWVRPMRDQVLATFRMTDRQSPR